MSQYFEAPSGAVFNAKDVDLFKELLHIGFIAWKPEGVTFKSGKISTTYVRGRQDLTNNPHILFGHLGPRIAEFVRQRIPIYDGRQHCLIGIPTAGTKLAMAAAAHSFYNRTRPAIIYRDLRTNKKDHGEDNTWAVGGPEMKNDVYVTIEQAMSTGSSMIEHAVHLKEDGYPVQEMHHVILVDRELGGVENLKANGLERVHTLYLLRDIVAALVAAGSWPAERYQELLREINLDAERRKRAA